MPLQLAFESTGEGSPVVILHGLFGSSRNWRSIAHALAPHHRVLCVDLRNHGQSPWSASMSYPEMAADVRMLIEAEGLGRPVLVGHSMGGKTAMALALECPQLVSRLVVVDIVPVSYPDRMTPYLQAMRSVGAQSLEKRADGVRLMADKIPDPGAVAFLMQSLITRDEHFDWRVNLAAIGAAVPTLSAFPHELLLRNYRGPTTLIYGAQSEYVKADDLAGLDEVFPALRSVEIAGAGHWVHADRQAEFLAALELAPARTG